VAHVAGAAAIAVALLSEPVERFITDTTAALEVLAQSVSRPLSSHLARDVGVEAFNIAAAFVDADQTHTDDELAAIIGAFAGRLETDLTGLRPADLRQTSMVTGKRSWITTPTPLFLLLIDADHNRGTQLAWRYFDDAMRIAHAACAIDSLTTESELAALERFRNTLLAAMEKGGLRNPWTGRTPLSGRLPDEVPQPATPVAPEPPAASALGPVRPIEELLSELNGMVGLAEVKAQVRLVTNVLRVQQMRRQRHLPVPETSHHLVFTGNPGTGKTTVARLLAQIYRTLGVVDKGQLVETERAGMVAGFVGQTAIKTTQVVLSAIGGVLLIDEAYALLQGQQSDFGGEAVDTLVKLLEDKRDELVVIVAGYPDEMGEFLDANPGLRSRFPRTITFPDYTTDELIAIFDALGKENSYQLTEDARTKLRQLFDAAPRGKGFGNGRLARNLFEAAIGKQANRIVTLTDPSDADLCQLTADDIG
jgi:Cdc6-like AAA superfamily ATPase